MNPTRFTDRLRALNRGDRTPVRAEVPGSDIDGLTATIRLYDPIDGYGENWGISAKEFAVALDGLPSNITEIRLHINSPGGDVFDGIAIVNALRAHKARIVAVVDGIAASAASFIACAADETIMAPNSELMIHDAWGLCVGNAGEMREMADMLDHISDNIASIYAAKAGSDTATWRAAMSGESWYSAAEAVAAGLADSVTEAKPADEVKNRHDLSIFQFAGRDEAPTPQAAEPIQTDALLSIEEVRAAEDITIEDVQRADLAAKNADEHRRRQLAHLVASTPGVAPLSHQAS